MILPFLVHPTCIIYIHLLCPSYACGTRNCRHTVALDSPEYIDFLHNSGVTTRFEVRLNTETRKRVVKCDICGVFISLTSKDHTIRFSNHRDSDSCKREEKRNARNLKLAKVLKMPQFEEENVSTVTVSLEEPLSINPRCVRPGTLHNFIQHMTEEHLTEEGRLASCPPELIVSTHISKSEEQWMGIEPERTTTYRITNKHFGVHDSDDSVFNFQEVFEQRKRAASSLSQASNSSQQPSPTKRGRIHDTSNFNNVSWAIVSGRTAPRATSKNKKVQIRTKTAVWAAGAQDASPRSSHDLGLRFLN